MAERWRYALETRAFPTWSPSSSSPCRFLSTPCPRVATARGPSSSSPTYAAIEPRRSSSPTDTSSTCSIHTPRSQTLAHKRGAADDTTQDDQVIHLRKRVRTNLAHFTPKWPIPRRRISPLSAPRSPSSPLFTSAAAQRRPGGAWAKHATHPSPAAPSPPTILISPPETEVACILARFTHPSCVQPAWQSAFVHTLFTRDQIAFEHLAWQIDLVFAQLASPSPSPSQRPMEAHASAKHAARHTIDLLSRAWRPTTAEDYRLSPPSFRLSSMTREFLPFQQGGHTKAHILWSHRISGSMGADITEKISLHIAHTIWYMAARDPNRPYIRPVVMAQFCCHLLAYLRRWDAHESAHPCRLLPITHLSTLSKSTHQPLCSLCTSAILHLVIRRALLAKLTNFDTHRRMPAGSHTLLQVPGTHVDVDSMPATLPNLLPDIDGSATIDAARFVGELARLRAVVTHDTVEQWLRALFLHNLPWIQVPMHELEAGCALLLLTGALTQHSPHRLDMSACTLHDRTQNGDRSASVHAQCLDKLEELACSPWVPVPAKVWIKVRHATNIRTSFCSVVVDGCDHILKKKQKKQIHESISPNVSCSLSMAVNTRRSLIKSCIR